MKLKLYFNDISQNELNISLNVDTIILHNGTYQSEIDKVYSINSINLDRANYVKEYQSFLDNLEKNLKVSKEINDIIHGHSNGFFNCILIELIKWVETINLLAVKYTIDELIINDYVNSSNYIPFYESEGEINRGLFYKKFDFIPHNLYLIFKKNYKISICNKHSKVNLLTRIFFRRYILLIVKFIIHIFYKLKSIISSTNNNPRFDYIKENHKLFISRGIAHTDFMKNYLDDESNNVSLLVGEGLFNFGKNQNKVKLYNLKNVFIEKENISFISHFTSFFGVLKLLVKKRNLTFIVKFKSYDIDISSAVTEFIIHHFDVLLHTSAIENVIKKLEALGVKNISIFTGEFYGCFAFAVGKIGKAQNIESYQLQNFVCDKIVDVCFLNCKNILFHSRSEQEKFVHQYPQYKKNFLFWGNIRYGKLEVDLQYFENIGNLRLLYFTQPVLFREEQNEILNYLLNLKQEGLVSDFAIKIHPREKEKDYEYWKKKQITIFNGFSIIDRIINNYDIAILQTSAVGQQLVLAGIPVLICQISANTQQISADYISNNYIGNITSIRQIKDRIIEYKILVDSFIQYRNDYIISNSLDYNIDYFNKQFAKHKVNK